MTPQETDPDLPVSVQESPAEVWVGSAAAGSGALSAAVHAQDLEGSRHYLHHLQHSLASRQTQGGNTAPPINRKLD